MDWGCSWIVLWLDVLLTSLCAGVVVVWMLDGCLMGWIHFLVDGCVNVGWLFSGLAISYRYIQPSISGYCDLQAGQVDYLTRAWQVYSDITSNDIADCW